MAVKALHVGKLEDWKAVELFEREGAVLKSLDHPGIPSYIDAFFDEASEDGTFYLVQEYVDGDDLESRLEAGEQWDEGRAREVMRQVLESWCTSKTSVHR